MPGRSWLALSLLAWTWIASTAAAQSNVAGTFTGTPSEVKVEVSTWGKDCGQKPASHTDPQRPEVQVRMQGTHLQLVFPDRTLKTDGCWSQNPAVRPVNATAAAGRWRSECRTPEGDPKRERGVYTVTASSDNELSLLEESDYNWQLNESRCVAKLRVTQTLRRAGTTAPAPPVEEPEPEPAPTACTLGEPTRIRIHPSGVRIAPGTRVCFSVRGTDAAGCTQKLDVSTLSFELTKPASLQASLSGACFKAASNAAEAEGRFTVTVRRGALRDSIPVVVATQDLSDITARRGGTTSELDTEAAGEEGTVTDFGISAAVARSSLAAQLAVGALLLALVAFLTWAVLRRVRRPALADELADEPAPASVRSARPRPAVPSAPADGPQLICPECRRGYPPGTQRCPNDGRTPIPYDEFVRKARESDPRTCPACGAQLAAGAQFCGECGAKVRA